MVFEPQYAHGIKEVHKAAEIVILCTLDKKCNGNKEADFVFI